MSAFLPFFLSIFLFHSTNRADTEVEDWLCELLRGWRECWGGLRRGGISAKLNGNAWPDVLGISTEDNKCSKWLSVGWRCLSWLWARYWCKTGEMGAVHLELKGEQGAELVMLYEIYHINASTLITPVNQQGSGPSESCLLSPPKMLRLVYSWSARFVPTFHASSQGRWSSDGLPV